MNHSPSDHIRAFMQHETCIARTFVRSIIALLGASLLLSITYWLLYGLDIPYWDDWRPYLKGEAGDFSLSTLFQPANDTLYPVGLALDALAQRFLLGNSLAYQFLSMTFVLGGLLVLQWRLLQHVLRDRVLVACAASASIFMLQPGSYWGMQNMAYHQAIPLLALLYALDLIYCQTWRRLLSPLQIFVAGLIAGLTYISGAFSMLAAGLALFGAIYIANDTRRKVLIGAISLTAAGVATSIPQGWVIAFYQKGTHLPSAPMALPNELDFWMFLLGKIGRSLLLPSDNPVLALLLTIGFTALAVASVFWLGVATRNTSVKIGAAPSGLQIRSQFGICSAIIAAVACYLLLVSAGRANLRDPSVNGPLEIFSLGFMRFHFFWVTVVWPWVVAAALRRFKPRSIFAPIILSATILSIAAASGSFKHADYYRDTATLRQSGLDCIDRKIKSGAPLTCGSIYSPTTDLRNAIQFAETIGSSFIRLVSLEETIELGFHESPPFPLPLNQGDVLTYSFTSNLLHGDVSDVGVFVGTYNGASDGTIRMELCQGSDCRIANSNISDASDNDFLAMNFDQPLAIQRDQPVTISLSIHDATLPLAIWTYTDTQWTGTQTLIQQSGKREHQSGVSARFKFKQDFSERAAAIP